MSIATIDNHTVHYEVKGNGDPMVFLHGWIGSWRYWWPTMKAFSTKGRTLAIDFWGFGDSSKVPEKYLFGSYVDQLAHFIEHLGIANPITLVGHSLGAAVALRYANLWPNRVKRLALVSPPLDGSSINQQLAEMSPEQFTERYLHKYMKAPELIHEIAKSDQNAVNSVANQLIGYDFRTDIERIEMSVLVVLADRDQVVSRPLDEITTALRKDKRHHQTTLKNCDHFPMLEQPLRFYRLLLDFMRLDEIFEAAPRGQRRVRTP
jgi:pimeloyl-ACP methyl ester carboxylesterase